MITFKDIFNSSGDSRRMTQYGDIKELLDTGVVKVSTRNILDCPLVAHIHTLPITDAALMVSEKAANLTSTRGGDWHYELVVLAAAYLISMGKQVYCEEWANGKRVDLITQDKEWIIECGDTDAKPIREHLEYTCLYFAVLPFQSGEPTLYVFERGPNWDRREPAKIANEGVKL